MQTIRTGDVVADLSKPCNFYWYWFSREIGSIVYYLLFRSIPTYLAGMLLFGLGIPQLWQSWTIFCLAFVGGAFIGIAYRILYNIAAFWILEARAMMTLAITVAQFLTGSYIPLPLLPTWLRVIIDWLPFHGFMDLPVEILLAKVPGNTLWLECSRQLIWLILLTLLVTKLTHIARQRVVAQGG